MVGVLVLTPRRLNRCMLVVPAPALAPLALFKVLVVPLFGNGDPPRGVDERRVDHCKLVVV